MTPEHLIQYLIQPLKVGKPVTEGWILRALEGKRLRLGASGRADAWLEMWKRGICERPAARSRIFDFEIQPSSRANDAGLKAALQAVVDRVRARELECQELDLQAFAESALFSVELFALKLQLRGCVRSTLADNEIEAMRSHCVREGLSMLTSSFKVVWRAGRHRVADSSEPGARTLCYISARRGEAERTKGVEEHLISGGENKDYHIGMGQMLGYPDCCVRAYIEFSDLLTRVRAKAPEQLEHEGFLRLQETRDRSDSYNPILNNVFYDTPYHLISHNPCSYNCDASLRLARVVREALVLKHPTFARELESLLGRPVLVYPGNRRLLLDGTPTARGMKLKRVRRPREVLSTLSDPDGVEFATEPTFKDMHRMLSKDVTNITQDEEHRLRLWKGSRAVTGLISSLAPSLPYPPLLLPFNAFVPVGEEEISLPGTETPAEEVEEVE